MFWVDLEAKSSTELKIAKCILLSFRTCLVMIDNMFMVTLLIENIHFEFNLYYLSLGLLLSSDAMEMYSAENDVFDTKSSPASDDLSVIDRDSNGMDVKEVKRDKGASI